jgi:hypothetical protein
VGLTEPWALSVSPVAKLFEWDFVMRFWLGVVVLMVAGCGGGGGGTSSGGGGGGGAGIDPRLARIDIYEAQRLRVLGDPGAGVMGMPVTEDANVPVSGSAEYTGSASIILETMPDAAVIVGDARVAMDFTLNEVTGEMDNFLGTDPNGNLRNFDGRLTINEGSIGDATPNAWSLEYAGTVSAPGQSYVMAGTVEGEFLGNQAGAIAGLELEAEVVANGALIDGAVTIIGEGTVTP